ncbi:hypothetical protein [Paenibacillus sp. sgz500958]|uniref:hypothetical protein n=1 Tax=Paenibacillus sp. sgz500958 TaxID=3242475 RepID=UPI0036D2C0A1
MKRLSLQALIFFIALFSISSSVAFAAPRDTVSPYGLELQAWTANGNTDVQIHVYALDGLSAPPNGITNLKIQAFGVSGEYLFNQVYDQSSNLSTYETVKLQLDPEGREVKRVEVAAVVPGLGSKPKKIILTKTAEVLVRPDLTLANASAPATVLADEPFQVTVDLTELNGTSGAVARVDLLNGDQVLATINETQVSKGATVPLTFTAALHEPGVYPLTLRIIKTDIGQSNTYNDETSVTVQVKQPELGLQLPYFSSQYFYMPEFEMHYIGLRDGILYYSYHDTEGVNENFDFNTTVPGGMMQGGSLSVELYGTTTGHKYSFDLENITMDSTQQYPNQYHYQDDAKEILIDITPNGGGDLISITKNAGNLNSTVYYDGEWHQINTVQGEYAIKEEHSVVYTIKMVNNLGQTYVKSGTIVLEYLPTQFDEQWDWQNESNHSWGFHNKYEGILSSFN